MKRLALTLLLFAAVLAVSGQEIRLWSDIKSPTIRTSTTISNLTATEQMYTLLAQPGFKYVIQAIPIDSILIQAESFAAQQGVTNINGIVNYVDKVDWIKYAGIDLKRDRTKLVYRYAMGDTAPGQVEFRIGSITATPFATVYLPATGGWSSFVNLEMTIDLKYTGIIDIYITCTGSQRTNGSGGNIDWFMFK
ncbi:MAG: carbohydrate-binding protein [Chryseolinea sp.]